MFDLLQPWMNKLIWKQYGLSCEVLHQSLCKLSESMIKASEQQRERHSLETTVEDTWSMCVLDSNKEHRDPLDNPIVDRFKDEDVYTFHQINDILPELTLLRYRYLKNLKTKGIFIEEDRKLVLYSRCYNNNIESLHYAWCVPEDADECDADKMREVQRKCEVEAPKYHTRFMKRKFVQVAETLQVDCSKAKLRRLYTCATGDSSAARTAAEKAVDERIMRFMELEDEDIVIDLRKLNHRPTRFDAFFDAAAKFIDDEIVTSVDDRRHDTVVHMAKAMSANDLYK